MELLCGTWKWNGKIYNLQDYTGVCHGCNIPLEYTQKYPIPAVIYEETENYIVFIPIAVLICPECKKQVSVMQIFKNLNITKELQELVKHDPA